MGREAEEQGGSISANRDGYRDRSSGGEQPTRSSPSVYSLLSRLAVVTQLTCALSSLSLPSAVLVHKSSPNPRVATFPYHLTCLPHPVLPMFVLADTIL